MKLKLEKPGKTEADRWWFLLGEREEIYCFHIQNHSHYRYLENNEIKYSKDILIREEDETDTQAKRQTKLREKPAKTEQKIQIKREKSKKPLFDPSQAAAAVPVIWGLDWGHFMRLE